MRYHKQYCIISEQVIKVIEYVFFFLASCLFAVVISRRNSRTSLRIKLFYSVVYLALALVVLLKKFGDIVFLL